MIRNTVHLDKLVKGRYGRKIAYYDSDFIDETNILDAISKTIGVFNYNKQIVQYLWRYKNGDQPIRYRQKTMRDDIVNTIVENHAWEVVAFKTAQTYGEPIQIVALDKDDKVSKAVEKINRYANAANKSVRDISCGEWQSAVGTGFKALSFVSPGADIPFRITVPTPMNTYIIYSSYTQEPLASIQELKDAQGNFYYQVHTPTHEMQVKNSKLLSLVDTNGNIVKSKPHSFGDIPIIEYPNNQDRLSDIELIIDILDAINNLASNRMDAVEQFVQSWIKFVNCEVDEETFQQMKMMGALVVKSNNGSDNKADVDVMTQELNQTQGQVYKDDLWDNALAISAIPNKEAGASGSGDRAGAVELRGGWDFSKNRAKLKDPYVVESEMRFYKVMKHIISIRKRDERDIADLSIMQFEPHISHSPTDNMQVKAQVFVMLVNAGIHPLVSIKVCGLWNDSQGVYEMSKPYLDAIYKTIDDAEMQEEKAKELLQKYNEQTKNNSSNVQIN